MRLTHIPTGIVVTCQNEKSQIQNKASAMRVLQAKLLERTRQEERAEMDALGAGGNASWGNQMRSYVLHPYQMVKDLRTNHEVGDPSKVLDGEIDDFLEAGIRWRMANNLVRVNYVDHKGARKGLCWLMNFACKFSTSSFRLCPMLLV